MTKVFKLGLDYDGVITAMPDKFALLTQAAIAAKCEVHIITGNEKSFIEQKLKDFGIHYTHFFSILDHHLALGTKRWQNEKGEWFIADQLWNPAKGVYCTDHQINLHIDDSHIYQKYFTTPYKHFDNFKSLLEPIVDLQWAADLVQYLRCFKA